MSASLVDQPPVDESLSTLMAAFQQLQQEVLLLRQDNDQLRQQVGELRQQVGYWKSMHARALQRNTKLQDQLDLANAEIRQLKAERFGKQSEKHSPKDRTNQLDDPQQQATPKKKRGQQPGRPAPKRRDYLHLPARTEQIDLPQEEKVCDCCGKPLADLGHNDEGQQLEIETVVYRRVVLRKRYRRTCDCPDQPRTVTAPAPDKLLPKSLYGTSLWIHLLLEKFHLQRPTHRTIEQLRLLGADLASGTIADGMKRIEPLLTPIYEAIKARQTNSAYFAADETRWQVFCDYAGKAGPRWWLWLFGGEDSVVYVLDPRRSHDVPQSHFEPNVQGVLMVDRYSSYKAMEQVKEGKLVLAFCWAHVRRDFVRVGKGYPELTGWALDWLSRIRDLYRLERERQQHEIGSVDFVCADVALREQIALMATHRDAELEQKPLRLPCQTVLNSLCEHWSGLTLFVEDPRIPLDNNSSERLLRGPAVGRKNYYGSGCEWSGRLAMKMFSILATLALWKMNPAHWLSWYMEACACNGGAVPLELESFLPWNVSKARLEELQSPSPRKVSPDSS